MITRRYPTRLLSRSEGSLLIVALLFLLFATTAILSTMGLVTERTRDVRTSGHEMVAREAALSGVHQTIATIQTIRNMSTIAHAFRGIDRLDGNPVEGPGGFTETSSGQVLRDGKGRTMAETDVFVDVAGRAASSSRTITISAYAYVPSKADYAANVSDSTRYDTHCTFRMSLSSSHVFDYAYFINHWGWFFGDTIAANGSVRSNGQFDFGNYASTINGSPRYSSAEGTDLIGYKDDNGDGIKDGSDGGAYSGYSVVNADRIRGMGSEIENQHENQGNIPMPNISDLTPYEDRAISTGATIKVGSTTYVSGVLGDQPSEKKSLYLVGTEANPIVIDGSVVVEGSVILSGYVTGRGSIFAGGNVYIAKDLIFKNPPTTWRPAANDEATTEAWIQANAGKDMLGLYAREHIVVGNYTDSSWQSNVQSWVQNSLNKSIEDAGMDGVHNTRAGVDGVLGTADDDVLEGDNNWTVSRYTDEDAANGWIPDGFKVGDVIPGSGEDIDGDAKRDNATQMSEFNIPYALQSANWASNNLSASPVKYSDISTLNVKRVDGILYTNHTLAALMINRGGDVVFNGAIVSRNESIIYGANRLIMNHDERLTGQNGDFFNCFVPQAWDPIEYLQWEFRRILPISPTEICTPKGISSYFVGSVD